MKTIEQQRAHDAAYARAWRGKVRPDPDAVRARRFWARVQVVGDCWEWTGPRDTDGYGRVKINGRERRATHVAWEYANGRPFPAGMLARHGCDNPPCVKPAHLTPGDVQQNAADRVGRERQAKGETHGLRIAPERHARGSAVGGSRLTEDQVVAIRSAYAAGGTSHAKLAARFGVARTTVSSIVSGKNWSWLG